MIISSVEFGHDRSRRLFLAETRSCARAARNPGLTRTGVIRAGEMSVSWVRQLELRIGGDLGMVTMDGWMVRAVTVV